MVPANEQRTGQQSDRQPDQQAAERGGRQQADQADQAAAAAASLQQTRPATPPGQFPPGDPRGRSLQWGTRARPSNPDGGLTVDDINIGIYGDIPDRALARTRLPRGAVPSANSAPVGGFNVRESHELWSENAGELYEEAIQRRWSTATDLPWETARDLSDDVELAVCQVATELCQQAQTETDVISRWLMALNPAYHEVKLFLSTQLFDSARMFDGYRKRAMLNGGGMLLESPGWVNRIMLEIASGWSEAIVLTSLVRGSFTHTLLRYLAAYGPTELDRQLAWRLIPDKTRHIAYTMGHLRFAFSKRPELARSYAMGLAAAERQVARDEDDHVLWEALAIIFGGGIKGMDDGMDVVKRLRRSWVNAYLDRLDSSGVPRRELVIPALREWIEEPAEEQAEAAAAPA